jgi:hypothetical protein
MIDDFSIMFRDSCQLRIFKVFTLIVCNYNYVRQAYSLADLNDLYRILYFVYKANYEGQPISVLDLQSKDKLFFMHKVKKLAPSLFQLRKAGYVEGPDDNLQLTGEGLQTIESIFYKFLNYLRKYHSEDDLSYWIRTLEPYSNTIWALIENTYFHVQKDTPLRSAFSRYLNEIGSIRNAIPFQVKEEDLGMLVDNIFINLDQVNKLFQFKFKCKLFCPPVAACAFMSRAVRASEPDLTGLVAVIGTLLNSVCQKEIEKLSTTTKGTHGPINKIKVFLDSMGNGYNANTIETLKTLYRIRSKTFPLHDTGPEIIEELTKLNISVDTDDYNKALKILNNLNNCLIDMKSWFN